MLTLLTKVRNKLAYEWYRRIRARNDFNRSYEAFLATDRTPAAGHAALVTLYCASNGRFNDQEQRRIAALHPPQQPPLPLQGIPGTFGQTELKDVQTLLARDGYASLNRRLPKEMVERLREYAMHTKARVPPAYDTKILYDPAHPRAELYRFDLDDLVNNTDIQALIMDPVLINIARNYLGSEPIFDFPAMWWSTTFLKEASAEAAQLYHFDLDRIKWLKLFVYLTDVTPDTGPHYYIRGTHRAGAKPRHLLRRGYVRIPDGDVVQYYPASDIVEVTGEAGSMFFGDTKCWHKGAPLKMGRRLVLELQYTSSLFGIQNPPLKVLNASDAFKTFCKEQGAYASAMTFI